LMFLDSVKLLQYFFVSGLPLGGKKLMKSWRIRRNISSFQAVRNKVCFFIVPE
jgi:hypothetical protein